MSTIIIFLLTIDQKYVRAISCINESTDNYNPTLQFLLAPWSILVSFTSFLCVTILITLFLAAAGSCFHWKSSDKLYCMYTTCLALTCKQTKLASTLNSVECHRKSYRNVPSAVSGEQNRTKIRVNTETQHKTQVQQNYNVSVPTGWENRLLFANKFTMWT